MAPPTSPRHWPTPAPHLLLPLARSWLDEDLHGLDPCSQLIGCQPCSAHLICKSEGGVLAGSPFAEAVWGVAGCAVTWLVEEGSLMANSRTLVAEVTGPAHGLLLAERAALNCLSRLSGVATAAHRASRLAEGLGWAGRVAGSRKTTPGFRLAEKYALAVGGAEAHRAGLGAGMLLLKDNHVTLMGGAMEKVVGAGRAAAGFHRLLGVECSSLDEALGAAQSGADLILLDNFKPQDLHPVACQVKEANPGVVVEASGGITLESLPHFLGPHIDVISMGSLTHSCPALDFALRVLPPASGEAEEEEEEEKEEEEEEEGRGQEDQGGLNPITSN